MDESITRRYISTTIVKKRRKEKKKKGVCGGETPWLWRVRPKQG